MTKAAPYPWIENPSTQMFWKDLHDEPGLKMCSLAARGLWTHHMLAIMAGAGGYLAVEGFAITISELALFIGVPLKDVQTAFAELAKYRVFSLDKNSTPYNRRMVRAHFKAKSARENGQKGGRPTKLKTNGKSKQLTQTETQPITQPEPKHNPNDLPRARVFQDSQDSIRKKEDDDAYSARENRPVWIIVGERVLDIMGVRDDPRWLGNYSLVEIWIKRGFDPDLDIYPTVTAIMAKRNGQGPPGNIKYFDNAIAQANADRTRIIPEAPNARRSASRKLTPSERVKALIEGEGFSVDDFTSDSVEQH